MANQLQTTYDNLWSGPEGTRRAAPPAVVGCMSGILALLSLSAACAVRQLPGQ
jgi:hypothetical protein